jgi:uncharacterized membrane protein YhaH (DUF805 family)
MNLLFGFSGRIGRLQWWLAQLANAGVLLAGVVILVMAADPQQLTPFSSVTPSAVLIVVAVVALAVWINAACTVKRFHDRDKSGFWFFIVFVPYVGGIWQIVECGFLAGSPGVNNYGPPSGTPDYGDLEDVFGGAHAEPQLSQLTPAAPVARPRVTSPTRSVPTRFGRRGNA